MRISDLTVAAAGSFAALALALYGLAGLAMMAERYGLAAWFARLSQRLTQKRGLKTG